MKKTLPYLLALCWAFNSLAQTPISPADTTRPIKVWDKTFGGSDSDDLWSMLALKDGGFLLGGYSASGISGDKTEHSRSHRYGKDYWIIKTDSNGVKVWDKRYGGVSDDELKAMIQTTDGGFLLGGTSYSMAVDTTDKTAPTRGSYDLWIVKTDADGKKLWDKSFGGDKEEYMSCIIATPDGGYLLGGNSKSGISGNKTEASRGESDYWVVKIDANGTKLWDKCFGGKDFDVLTALTTTNDGGYLLGGYSPSDVSGNKTAALIGWKDFWVVKIDAVGNKLWDKAYGGNSYAELRSLVATSDGNYVLGGYSDSFISGNKTEESRGEQDFWLVKIDNNGTQLWDRVFGGVKSESSYTMQATEDGGVIAGGISHSKIGRDKTENSNEQGDFWVVKTDKNGKKHWDKTIGTDGFELMTSVLTTIDGGYLLGGYTYSGISGDKTQPERGNGDYWIVKIKSPKP